MNAASALAAGSIAFKASDPAYSATLLKHAEELFAFAERCPGDWIKDGMEGGREGGRESFVKEEMEGTKET